MATLRKPFQGVWNIIRFNWHFYAISAIGIIAVLGALPYLPLFLNGFILLIITFSLLTIVVSLIISYYIYDVSNLYDLSWIKSEVKNPTIVNINAGFDETSGLIKSKIPDVHLKVLDFYDPLKHTEVSIKRARKAYPEIPGTISVTTQKIPLKTDSVDIVVAMLSAHEIRANEERIQFFKELRRIKKLDGQLYVIEHLRDVPNFLAYNIGFLHFHSRKTWEQTFEAANLKVVEEIKITPFISKFKLTDGDTP